MNSTQPQDTIPSLPVWTETRACTSPQLQSASSALPPQTVISDALVPVLRNAMSPSPPVTTTDLSPIQSQNAILYAPFAPELCASPVSLFDDDKYLRRLSSISVLPFCQLRDDLLAQGMSQDPSNYLDFLLGDGLRLWHPIQAIRTVFEY